MMCLSQTRPRPPHDSTVLRCTSWHVVIKTINSPIVCPFLRKACFRLIRNGEQAILRVVRLLSKCANTVGSSTVEISGMMETLIQRTK